MSKIKVYTDGSCNNNTGQGGWAYIITEDDKELHRDFGIGVDTTSNRMELEAILNAMDFCNIEVPFEQVEIYSDSRYCVKGYMNWMHKWSKRDWFGVKNTDLWKRMFENDNYKLFWVKGHSDNKWNNEVDSLADYKKYL